MSIRESERLKQKRKIEKDSLPIKLSTFLEQKNTQEFLNRVKKGINKDILIRRMKSNYAFSSLLSEKIFCEYEKFLALKIALKTGNYHEEISPSLKIDLMWHQHVLDTQMYAKTWKKIGGGLMHHSIDNSIDQKKQQERLALTVDLYQNWFMNNPPDEIWKDDNNLYYYSDISETFSIFVMDLTGKGYTVSVKNEMTVLQLKDLLEEKSGIPPSHMRLIFAGKQLADEYTMEKYGIRKEVSLHLIIAQKGC